MPQRPNAPKMAVECYQLPQTFCGPRFLPAVNQFKLKWTHSIKTNFNGHFGTNQSFCHILEAGLTIPYKYGLSNYNK